MQELERSRIVSEVGDQREILLSGNTDFETRQDRAIAQALAWLSSWR